MSCNHDIEHLIGTAEGITCRACGAKFKTFAEIKGKKEAPKTEETPAEVTEETTEEVTEEKPKAKSRAKKGGK